MVEEISGPLIGQREQSLFAIPDTRERAIRLREGLTPRLALVLEWACGDIEDAYGADSLIPYRIVLTPANRRKATKTKSYDDASAGLAVKPTGGERQHWYFQQRIECSSSHAITKLFGHRGREVGPIVTVLNRHKQEAARLLDNCGSFLWQSGIHGKEGADGDRPDFLTLIARLRTGAERDWSVGLSIEGPDVELPLLDRDSAWPLIYDFVALFPLFRAATDILLGDEDRFPIYARQFWEWDATLVEDGAGDSPVDEGGQARIAAIDGMPDVDGADDTSREEGGIRAALERHRIRERRLRKRKIRDALRRGNGRLRCDVPGCGFDFYEVYGEIGKDFAHVHHLEPLAGPAGPRRTGMGDLAIVCANCHAMIHRGGGCRPLEGLIGERR